MASIQKVGKSWQYRVSYKSNELDKNGKVQYKTKTQGGFRTKKEASIAAAELESKFKRGQNIDAGEQFFSDYMRNWFNIYHKGKHKNEKHEKDIERSVLLVKKHFVEIRMKDLTRDIYQDFLNKIGPEYSQETIRKRHLYIKLCLKDALEDEVIRKNPTYKAVVKGLKPTKEEDMKYLNFEELKRLVAEIREKMTSRYLSRFIILFAIATGARFSEILGMTWDCVDFENMTITINKTWSRDNKGFGDTKNYSSKRTITIDKDTCNLLRILKNEQNKNAVKTGLRNKKNLCFVNTKLELVTNNAVNKTLKSLCKKVGAKEITCHCLRHTHASMLLYKGVNIKYISRRLGHKDIVTTLQTYSHIMDEMEQKESRQVDVTMEELYCAK
ncbi:site-specific integrase [Cytobacillus depressus]|uniref:Site-specific integrase n=1 Tax=Cytobacillus depressus TaxID=1602942 RepID=A0A6L3VAQ1_9BACI|nr:tyrosine-type recombinase/integrase [Cytobacillus depressus]KAB2337619.1 site-specific integrase [Cytobacillus depressus]